MFASATATRLRVPLVALSLTALLALTACGGSDAGGSASADAVLYEGARIISGDGSAAIENGAFLVENGRFTQVGRSGELNVPAGVPRVDLAGKTVMPALVNTHVHMSVERDALVDQLQHYAYYGVGTVQSLGLDSGTVALQMRETLVPGASRYLTSMRGITSPEPGRSEVPFWVTSEDEARSAVSALDAQGVELVKIWVDDRNGQYEKLSPALYGAVIEEAHRSGQKVAAHIFSLEDAKGLLRAGLDAFAHSIRDMDVDDEVMTLLAERPDFVLIPNLPDRGVAVDLSWLSGTVPAAQLADMQSRSTDRPAAQASFGIQARNLARMSGAGVRVAMGTDGSVPWAAHLEMEDMVASGMTPAQVITASTRTGAEFLGLTDVGSVASGQSADFLVLDADPLTDITNTRRLHAVYLRGQIVDRGAVSARLTGGM